MSTSFLGGSRGIYRPIRGLFDTPIYDLALQVCWNIQSYKSQIALVMELLRLQQEDQIPSQVTAEDMVHLLLEDSKCSLRECLWELKMQEFDEEEDRPLLKLVMAVNVSNRSRDVECEARMLLYSPEEHRPYFGHPKVTSIAQDYAVILRGRHQEKSTPRLLCPSEVVLEVVPKVLQAFWEFPHRPIVNMFSQQYSTMSVGVTKAVVDRIRNSISNECRASFSRATRDDMVLEIQAKIRKTWPCVDVLVNLIDFFAPVLLGEIVDVSAGQIVRLFLSQGVPKVPVPLSQRTSIEPPDNNTPVHVDIDLKNSCEANSAVPQPPPASPASPAEPLSVIEIQTAGKGLSEQPSPMKDLLAETTFIRIQAEEDVAEKPEKVPNFVAVPPSPPTKTLSNVHAREDGDGMSSPENDLESAEQLVLHILAQAADLPYVTIGSSEDSYEKSSLEEDLRSVTVLSPPPPERPSHVEAKKDVKEKLSLRDGLDSKVRKTKRKLSQRFFLWLCKPLRCCFVSDPETD